MLATQGYGVGSVVAHGYGGYVQAEQIVEPELPQGAGGGGTYTKAVSHDIVLVDVSDRVFSANRKKAKKSLGIFEQSIGDDDLDVGQKEQYEQMSISSEFEKQNLLDKILIMQNQVNFDMEKFFFYKSKYEASEEMKEKYERSLKKLQVDILFYKNKLEQYRKEFLEQRTLVKELNKIVEMQKQQIQTSAQPASVPLIMFLCTTFGIALGAGLAVGAGLLATQILSGMHPPPAPLPLPPPPKGSINLLML